MRQHGQRRWWGALASVLAWAMMCCAAGGQEAWLPAVGSPLSPGARLLSGHAWFVAPLPAEAASGGQFLVLHCPPREASGDSLPGMLRPVTRLGARPEVMAAWEGELYMVFSPSAAGGKGRQRRVVRMTAVTPRFGMGAWEYIPASGPEVRPSLPGDGELIAACGTAIGPAVLMQGVEGKSGLRMLVLRGEVWMAAALPDAVQAVALAKPAGGGAQRSAWIDMAATRDGPVLAWAAPGSSQYSTARTNLTGVSGPDGEAIVTHWETQLQPKGGNGSATGEEGGPVMGVPRDRRLIWADGQLAVVGRDGDEPLRVWAVREGRATLLATVAEEAAPPMGVAALDGIGRLAAMRTEISNAPAANAAGPRLHVAEISLYTGEVLFSGPASGKLFSGWPVQVLMMGIGGIMLAVLMFVLKGESNDALPLPEGLALAPPGKRLAAAVIDGAIALLASSIIHGVAPLKILSPATMLRPEENWAPLVTAVVIAFLSSVMLEWLTGRTLGKRLLGIGVVGYRPARKDGTPTPEHADPLVAPVRVGDLEMGRPNLLQAVLRNAIRWFIPPLAALVLFDPNWRHPGDVLARTLVLTPVRDADETQGED